MYGLHLSSRIDLVLRFKLLKTCGGKVCSFSCLGKRQETTSIIRDQFTKYKLDCYWQGHSRWQWIHKEEREFHDKNDARSYSIPVTPICVSDFAEVSVTLMSLMGALDLSSLYWQHPKFEPMPNQSDIRQYNRSENMTPDRNKLQKYFADLSRVCDLEDNISEWFGKEHYEYVSTEALTTHIRH